MKIYSTNYINTFIEAAEDCPVTAAQSPPAKEPRTAARIEYDMLIDNPLVSIEEIRIGRLAGLIHNGSLYNSVLTGYVMNNDSPFITLRFGSVRSTFQSVLAA